MLWANSPLHESYQTLIHLPILTMSLQHFINDGLMAIFFFVIGIEIKKEFLYGELSSKTKASLPIVAALGGMIIPALIYHHFNQNTQTHAGWGIPMATDIAFALGVLSLLEKKVPLSLKIFLLALAIVDDLGAILVIAVFYTAEVSQWALMLAAVGLFAVWYLQRFKIKSTWIYILLGLFVWYAVLKSGIHATIAGVLLGFLVRSDENGFKKLEYKFKPWVNYAIMPIFALANAGVRIEGFHLEQLFQEPVVLGVVLGLFVGKPLGILLFSFVAVKLRLAQLPRGSNWAQIGAVGCFAGIGFTMALFISNLALSGTAFEGEAKIAILIASLLSSALGLFWLKLLRDV